MTTAVRTLIHWVCLRNKHLKDTSLGSVAGVGGLEHAPGMIPISQQDGCVPT